MNVQPNTSRGFTDHSTILEGVVDTLNGIVLHTDQETRAQLGVGGAGIEKCGRSVGEIAFGHEIIGLNNTLNIRSMDAHSNTHKQVLRPLGGDPVDLQQVRPFEGFEAKAERGSIKEGQVISGKTYKL